MIMKFSDKENTRTVTFSFSCFILSDLFSWTLVNAKHIYYLLNLTNERNIIRKLSLGRWHTSSQYPLSLHSYGAELEVKRKHPSPFQLKVASL